MNNNGLLWILGLGGLALYLYQRQGIIQAATAATSPAYAQPTTSSIPYVDPTYLPGSIAASPAPAVAAPVVVPATTDSSSIPYATPTYLPSSSTSYSGFGYGVNTDIVDSHSTANLPNIPNWLFQKQNAFETQYAGADAGAIDRLSDVVEAGYQGMC